MSEVGGGWVLELEVVEGCEKPVDAQYGIGRTDCLNELFRLFLSCLKEA